MDGILLEKKDGIAVLTVDIPATRNALSVAILQYMDTLVDQIIADKSIHCMVLTGGGEKTFVAGADISGLVKMTPEEARYSIEVGHALFTKIETMDIPTIAAINGYCLGGGLEIAMCCDIRLCSANAKFGLPEINIGMIPGWGGTLRLPRLIGESRAKNMILRGMMITAEEAQDFGLIAEVCESVEVLKQKTMEVAKKLATSATITMKTSKRLIYDGVGKQPTDIAQRDALALAYIYTTKDAIEGLTAFLEKRTPEYRGE